MKRLLVLLLALIAAPAFGQSVVQTENVRAELLADVSAVKPGEPFWVGLRQTIRPKWHTYWKNPGDSGLPTEIVWKLPEGAKAEPIVWPRPHLFDLSGVINYGFKDEAVLLVQVTPATTIAGDFAMTRSQWLIKGKDRSGKPTEVHHHGMEVHRRLPDGSWVFFIDHPFGADAKWGVKSPPHTE